MLGIFAALGTELVESKFVGCIYFVSFGNIILALANRADEPDDLSISCLCHYRSLF